MYFFIFLASGTMIVLTCKTSDDCPDSESSENDIVLGPLYMFVYIFRGRATDTGFEFLRSIGTTFVETLF